ncbi:MAG TPA: glucoamylase family protein [Polyangiaceae bacterium]|jgi:cyclic beta-1,2-glucan synthetase|nr:glucoamylase family protein [Polyangiaceae bacterium]
MSEAESSFVDAPAAVSDCPALDPHAEWDDPDLLRGAIYSRERLAAHALELARSHGESSLHVPGGLLAARIVAARETIRDAYAVIAKSPRAARYPTPAEEWLVDNSHIVSEQLREIDEDLPHSYLKRLPRLVTGAMRGYPRVYGLCLDYLRHTDVRIDPETLAQFVESYQTVNPLTIGELWAIPIMLRLGLILTTGSMASAEVKSATRLRRASVPPVSSSDPPGFASVPPPPPESTNRMSEPPGERASDIVLRREHARQAADQVLIGNAITSMRVIAAHDWPAFFERTSLVERILREDPHGTYAATEKKSRDRYRHVVEELAERSDATERGVAQAAIDLAREATNRAGGDGYARHVGYYLVDDGKKLLEEAVGYRPRLGERTARFVLAHPLSYYLGSISLLTAALWMLWARDVGRHSVSLWLALAVVAFGMLPLSEMALAFVNAVTVTLLQPRVLSKLSLEDGIPEDHRTLVAVPVLVDGEKAAQALLHHLEVRALANLDPRLHFALLTDLKDSDVAERPEDVGIVAALERGVAELNARNGGAERDRFMLFHRPRLWNASQGVFMGWERKRGKLEELNRLIAGEQGTTFTVVTAKESLYLTFRHVITLDADTELPRDTANELVGTLIHPLNRPRWNAAGNLVGGYGVVQPRVGSLPTSSRRTRFARITSGPPGIDPYTNAISDVYQDLFASGSFVGKGIYDVEVFNRVLGGRVPENSLLSHDLFEGIFARTALASDIELFDTQPSSYAAMAARQHRWIRGDFQLLPWLFPRVPSRSGKRPSDVPVLGWWKLFDNLRRALVAPALVAAALLGWFAGRGLAPLATALVAFSLTAPLYSRIAMTAIRSPNDGAPAFGPFVSDLWTTVGQIFLGAVFALDQAIVTLDATLRTLYRLTSRKKLLEWQTAGQAEREFSRRLPSRIWLGAVLAATAAVALAFVSRASLPFALPVLALWISAPAWALYLARPSTRNDDALSPVDVKLLRVRALQTWRFFETFVTKNDNHLPPDNFQEEPLGVIAHRTSPTNMGGYLLSILAARDFGFITLAEVAERLEATLTTMEGLERHEGHILNWYDTTTLKPLQPAYVSTVDSGNLAAYLWTVGEAAEELARAPIASPEVLRAAEDAFALSQAPESDRPRSDAESKLATILTQPAFEATIRHAPPLLAELDIVTAAARAAQAARTGSADVERTYWLEKTCDGVARAATELRKLAPFLERIETPPPTFATGSRAAAWESIRATLAQVESLRDVMQVTPEALARLTELDESIQADAALPRETRETAWRYIADLSADLRNARGSCQTLRESLKRLGERARSLADGMNFSFLYDRGRHLFSIGYNVQASRLDGSFYDLLASEARLASFVAIAKGDVPQENWFRLGRPITGNRQRRALCSWTGSMFEYLMPLLVMKDGDETLLRETHVSVVETQRDYGIKHGTPWGISESLFDLLDLSMTYQYRAFGVPGLGLKKGLEDDHVIAPYATALAAQVCPSMAVENLRALERAGLLGRFGYYESIDYTPSRMPPGRRGVVVKAFMAHHQGMALVAFANALHAGSMQRRFHAEPRVQATELLLEERIPTAAPIAELRSPSSPTHADDASYHELVERVQLDVKAAPRAHLLGHGDVSTIVTTVGTGVTMWRGLDVSRFREDPTLSPGGVYVYVRDLASGDTWSIGYEPIRKAPDSYEASFAADRVEIRRRDGDIESLLEVAVSPEFPAEVRRITLRNHGLSRRELEVTTYTELVLAPRNADRAHRVFSSMFVETQAVSESGALLAVRRGRGENEGETWALQVLTPEEGVVGGLDYETSRASFIGRGRDTSSPLALAVRATLAKNVGCVLDPVFALRRTVTLKAGRHARLSLATALATDRETVDRLVAQYVEPSTMSRTFELGKADARVELRHLGVSPADEAIFQKLLSLLVFPRPKVRSGGSVEFRGAHGKGALWSLGISGDVPIVILRVDEQDFADTATELLNAHEFFRVNGFSMDLLILSEEPGGYFHPMQDQATEIVRNSVAKGSLDRNNGGVFVRRADQLSDADRALVLRAAHVVLFASKGSLARQVKRALDPPPLPSLILRRPPREEMKSVHRPSLDFDNGIGGFDPKSGEYVMTLTEGQKPPMPWCNVIANQDFGFVVSESGASYSWSTNSQTYRLTPWSNDAVSDPPGECFYVRDADSGAAWSLTPEPCGGRATYTVRHGFGVTTFEHERSGLVQRFEMFVDCKKTAKVYRLSVSNRGKETRSLSIFGVVEWVLGSVQDRSALTVATSWDRDAATLVATNPLSPHPERCAFFTATSPVGSFTGDRSEFFGYHGSRKRPAALDRTALSGRTGAGLDPCGALEVRLEIAPGATEEVSFVLGDGPSLADAMNVAKSLREPGAVARSFEDSMGFFHAHLKKITVKTPDPAFDYLLNGWLLYQATSCRILARTGFYQSSGAYGFRDQLQDVMAMLHSAPEMARSHILRAAARQFIEGDVQHWWHADTGEGVRTRCSDDMLWLPYVTAEYVRATGDTGVLDESVPFLDDKPLAEHENESFGRPPTSTESASIYEHCLRAIDVGITSGLHGLPRMRAGDWNDGMNRVGNGEGGESTWLAWFVAKTLQDFTPLAARRGDKARVEKLTAEVQRLKSVVDGAAWDGAWYRRGYFADGTPLGSAANAECRIDAIAQSWAVISGIANPTKAAAAVEKSEAMLVRERERMMTLLWPPFQSKDHDPGYIRAYPPGVRENGGQYTHGVLWTVLARTMLGQGDAAMRLFSMMNPIHHGSSPAGAAFYGVEPYVVAADVSASPSHAGRGGWTWYTGAAGWMYRIGLEHILGIRLDGGALVVSPCVPSTFTHFEVDYRSGRSTYHIVVDNTDGVATGVVEMQVDGKMLAPGTNGATIPLIDDGADHEVRVRMAHTASTRLAVGAS